MVAGVKGVAFLDDTLAVSSSTAGELFLVSRGKRWGPQEDTVGRRRQGRVAGRVPKTRKVLVVDAKGHLCEVDCESGNVERVASAGHHATPPRLTSVCAWDSKTCFVAGAERGKKTKCACWRVDLESNKVGRGPCWRLT